MQEQHPAQCTVSSGTALRNGMMPGRVCCPSLPLTGQTPFSITAFSMGRRRMPSKSRGKGFTPPSLVVALPHFNFSLVLSYQLQHI
eukprot:jgi/Botrbrau1/8909/Bobra.0148s0024.1